MVKIQNKKQLVGSIALGLVLALLVGPGRVAAADNPLWGSEYQIIERTNQIRQESGLPALIPDSRLMSSAANKAKDMAERGYFDHMNTDGSRMEYWIHGAGYSYTLAGENIAKGFYSLDRLVAAWVNSSTHHKNLVEPRFTHIGVGMAEGWYEDQPTLFIVQHFGDEAVVASAKEIATVQPAAMDGTGVNTSAEVVPSTGGESLSDLGLISITPAMAADVKSLEVEVASLIPTPPLAANNSYAGLFALILLGLIGYLRETDWQRIIQWLNSVGLKMRKSAEGFLHYGGF